MAITETPPLHEPTPTEQAYDQLQQAYDHFNAHLFDGRLPPCLITLQRKGRSTLGYFSRKRFATKTGETTDEIALNPRHFEKRSFIEVMSTLVHEMVHCWQYHFGRPSRPGYHNKEWAGEMLRIGLRPSHTGEPGGRMLGDQMSHYVIEGGRFDLAARKLQAMVGNITWFDVDAAEVLPKGLIDTGLLSQKPRAGVRTVYRCPSCPGVRVDGKPSLHIICGECDSRLRPAGLR